MKRIDEMMDRYQITEEQDPIETKLSAEKKQAILARTLEKAGLNSMPVPAVRRTVRWSGKRILAVAAISILCCGILVASAAGYLGLDERFLAFLNPTTPNQVDELAIAGIVIDKKVEANGLTIHYKEAIGDHNSVYILYDVYLPEGMATDASQYAFEQQYLSFSDLSGYSGGWHSEELDDTDLTDGVKSFVLCADTSRGMKGKELTVDMRNFKRYDIDLGDYVPIVDGEWKTSFDLDYSTVSETYRVGETVALGEATARLKKVQISPLSVTAELQVGKDYMEQERTGFAAGVSSPLETIRVEIHLKDGTVLNTDEHARGGSTSSDGRGQLVWTANFDRILSLSEIEKIMICGQEIEMR